MHLSTSRFPCIVVFRFSEFTFLDQGFLLGFPGSSVGKYSTCNAGDPSLGPESGRSTGERKGRLFQYSGLENSRDFLIRGVAKSHTRLSDFHLALMFAVKACYTVTMFRTSPLFLKYPFTVHFSGTHLRASLARAQNPCWPVCHSQFTSTATFPCVDTCLLLLFVIS